MSQLGVTGIYHLLMIWRKWEHLRLLTNIQRCAKGYINVVNACQYEASSDVFEPVFTDICFQNIAELSN